MNALDFINANKGLAKTQLGLTTVGAVNKHISASSEAEIEAIATAIGWTATEVPSPENITIVDNGSLGEVHTHITSKGIEVPYINLAFKRYKIVDMVDKQGVKYKDYRFQFECNGKTLTYRPSKTGSKATGIKLVHDNGDLKVGDLLPFKLDSIKAVALEYGMVYNGAVLYDAYDKIAQAEDRLAQRDALIESAPQEVKDQLYAQMANDLLAKLAKM
jgi:hypothetical protein